MSQRLGGVREAAKTLRCTELPALPLASYVTLTTLHSFSKLRLPKSIDESNDVILMEFFFSSKAKHFNRLPYTHGIVTRIVNHRPSTYWHSFIIQDIKCFRDSGTSLVVQWLSPQAPSAGVMGLIPGQGTKIPHAAGHSQKRN